jgi:putative oxidoreductase
MKTKSRKRSQILQTENDNKLIFIRLLVGLIFVSEGIQKYMFLQSLGPGRFTDIGFNHPFFWAYFTGAFEISCGALVLFGLFTRLASIPLLIVMITAFITTKVPVLTHNGFWSFAHEYRTDFCMTLLLILLIIYGGGNKSADKIILHSKNN